MDNRKTVASLFWLSAAFMVIGQFLHPTEGTGELDRVVWAQTILIDGTHGLVAHTAFVVAFLFIFVGLMRLFRQVFDSTLGVLGLVIWGIASLSLNLAVMFNFLMPWSLAQDYLAASTEMRPFIEAQLTFSEALGAWFAVGLFIGVPCAFLCLGLPLARINRRFPHLLGATAITNSLLGGIATTGILLGQPWAMTVEAAFILLSAAWFIAVGAWVWHETPAMRLR